MAPSYPHRAGGGGSPQNRRFHTYNDRSARGHFAHQTHQSFNNPYATIGYQRRSEPRNITMTSFTAPRPDARLDEYLHLYPSQLPGDYNMVQPSDGSIPRYYIDSLPMEFYLRPAKEVRAVFSTNNGAHSVRSLPDTTDATTGRQVKLWSAEEIQHRANSVRKKHWYLMKSMPEPICWEDLYDYFDCVDLFHHGALNLWNLVCHLFHENKMLRDSLHHELCFQVGIWCDEWLARGHNNARLRDFRDWGNVLDLFDTAEVKEIRQLDRFSQDILRTALIHRQNQLIDQFNSPPPAYPCNTAAAQFEQSSFQNWLAGHPCPDTPSGLDHPVCLQENRVLESIPESPTKPGVAKQTPLVVDGRSRPIEKSRSRSRPSPPQNQKGELGGNFDPSCDAAMGSFGRPSNTPFTTGPEPGRWTQPSHGPVTSQTFTMPPSMHGPPFASSSNDIPSATALGGGRRHSSQMTTGPLSNYEVLGGGRRHSSQMTTGPLSNYEDHMQASRREPPSRFDPGQQAQDGPRKGQESPSIPCPQPSAPERWEKVGETANGPLWRRSPVKEQKFSKVSGTDNRSPGSRGSNDSAVTFEATAVQADPVTNPTARGATAATSREAMSSVSGPQENADGKFVVPPAETESQSKPPAEEALPETLEESQRLRGDESPCTNGKGKSIRVNLPVTPTKKQLPERSPTSPNTMANSCRRNESGKATEEGPTEPRTESPKYGKGSYRQVFTEETGERLDLYARPNTMPARSQPIILMASTGGESNGQAAKNAFDNLISNSLAQQSSGSSDMQNAPQTVADAPKKKKKNKKGGKNKKKQAANPQATEPSDSQRPTEEPSTTPSEKQEGKSVMPITHLTDHATETSGTEPKQIQSLEPIPEMDDGQAESASPSEVGGSQQLPQETQSAEPSVAVAQSEPLHSTQTNKPEDPEPATVGVATPELPGADRTIKPQSHESTSSVEQAPSEQSTIKRKLAPIPLVPKQHHKNSCCSSRTMSCAGSPSDSPTITNAEVKTRENETMVVDTAVGTEPGQKTPVSSTAESTDSGQKTPASSSEGDHADQEDTDNGNWQVDCSKRSVSEAGQPKVMNQPQHQPPAGKQEPKKRRSPKKKKVQGQDHLESRHASTFSSRPFDIGDTNKQSGLPPSSVWGKARSATTADPTGSGASTIPTKDNASGGSHEEDKSKK